MDIVVYKKIADEEINNPQWMVTKQFLEVNRFEKINNEYVWLIAHFGGWKSMTLEGLYGTTAILRSRHSKTTAFILPKRKAQ